eukprot:405471_1
MMQIYIFCYLIYGILSGVPDQGFGPYKPLMTEIKIGDLSQGCSQSAILWYPESSVKQPTFPFISFAHGYDCGGSQLEPDYKQLLATVASYGFIIAAPMSCCNGHWCPDFYKDVVTTIKTCKAKTGQINAALNQADFSNIGLMGHSMGAMSVVLAGIPSNHQGVSGISATVAFNPCFTSANPKPAASNVVPVMYWTGTSDTTCASWESYDAYNITKATPKTYSNLKGANHLEIFTYHPNRPDPYAVLFFQCLLTSNSSACNYVFANGKDSLCNNGQYQYSGCYVKN